MQYRTAADADLGSMTCTSDPDSRFYCRDRSQTPLPTMSPAYDHYGDIAHYAWRGEGYLCVPLEKLGALAEAMMAGDRDHEGLTKYEPPQGAGAKESEKDWAKGFLDQTNRVTVSQVDSVKGYIGLLFPRRRRRGEPPHQRPRWTTSSKGRRSWCSMGLSGRSAG